MRDEHVIQALSRAASCCTVPGQVEATDFQARSAQDSDDHHQPRRQSLRVEFIMECALGSWLFLGLTAVSSVPTEQLSVLTSMYQYQSEFCIPTVGCGTYRLYPSQLIRRAEDPGQVLPSLMRGPGQLKQVRTSHGSPSDTSPAPQNSLQ